MIILRVAFFLSISLVAVGLYQTTKSFTSDRLAGPSQVDIALAHKPKI